MPGLAWTVLPVMKLLSTFSLGGLFGSSVKFETPRGTWVVNVEVLPNKTGYKPCEKATVKLRLTDDHGEPVVGSAVVSVYDKSVEYISGGSNVPEIRPFFWKWRRQHYPHTESSLFHHFSNLVRNNETRMSDLGIFGATIVEELKKKGLAKYL